MTFKEQFTKKNSENVISEQISEHTWETLGVYHAAPAEQEEFKAERLAQQQERAPAVEESSIEKR